MNAPSRWVLPVLLTGLLSACAPEPPSDDLSKDPSMADANAISQQLAAYAPVPLTTDMSALTDNEREMIPLLIDAADLMNGLFWMQAYGEKELLMGQVTDADTRQLLEINYGPWNRLADNAPFLDGIGAKSPGSNLYPADMTKAEFEATIADSPTRAEQFKSLYTLIRRDTNGDLKAVPYHEAFATSLKAAAEKLTAAAELAEDPDLKNYLTLRAEALTTDNYQPSDLAWMDMKSNTLDIVIGAIETYEDQLYGYKAAYEGYVLVKDKAWSERLAKYASMLPGLQAGLPVPDEYKKELPGTDSDLNAYDVVYYAGDCNAGSKTIAINLPNDEQVQQSKGTRRLQLKNAMQAKFDKILVDIANLLIAEDQRKHVTFDAFFGNTMFHEVAHGLGIKETLDGSSTVRQALQEQASALEEGKADVLGLYMVTKLHEQGELGDADLMDNYVTFLASIFRSIRFGAASAHGRANLLRFNFFQEMEAFSRDEETGTYRIDFDKMQAASNALSERILRFQGDGDYEGVKAFVGQYGQMSNGLQTDLDRLAEAGIPVDIVFEQGMGVLN